MNTIWLSVGLLIGAAAGAWVMALLRGGELARLTNERDTANAAVESLAGARNELLALVKQGAGEELSSRGEELLKLISAQFQNERNKLEDQDAERKRAVADLVKPVSDGLSQLTKRLESVDRNREETERELTAQLRTVTTGQAAISRSTVALERALRQPHVRGRWGELSLKRLAEVTGMSQLCDFDEQPTVGDDGRMQRPDMLVKLPDGGRIVVDAKVPLTVFLDAMEAEAESERVEKLKLYARGIRTHVRSLSDKNYQAQFATAPDFTVLYMPGDHFLGAALEVDPELVEDAFARRVHIVTPATFLALLRTVAFTYQRQQMAEDAEAIALLGRELYDRIITLLRHIDDVSRCVNSLVKAQDRVVGSVETRLLPTAKKFSGFGVVGLEEKFPEMRGVGAISRRMQTPELSPGDVQQLNPPPAGEAA